MITFTEKGKPEGKDLGLDSGKGGAASICKLFVRKINIQFDLWNLGDVGDGGIWLSVRCCVTEEILT